jgi:hypothetical protein
MQSLVGIIALGILAALEYGRQILCCLVSLGVAVLVSAAILG